MTTKLKILFATLSCFILLTKTYCQDNQQRVGSEIKTIGVIDMQNILSPTEQNYLDSILEKFNAENSCRIVVIIADSSKHRDLFFKVRRAWGYTDTEVLQDICIITSSKPKSIAFWDDLVEKLLSTEERHSLIETYWLPNFKAGKYFDGLSKLIENLTLLVKVRRDQKRN